MDWCVWPAAQYLNFYLVPTHYRVVFVNFILFCWNVFLSYIKHNVSSLILFAIQLYNFSLAF